MNDKLLKQLQPLIAFARNYAVVLIIIAFGSLYAYLIYTSGKLAANEPSETKIAEKYSGAKRPKIDEDVIDKINELKDQNVQFQSLLDEARKNPFVE